MNQKNYDYLKDNLKYLGFGEGLSKRLGEELATAKPAFQLTTVNEYGRDKVNYTLDFKKSDNADMYFFNRYTASFKPEHAETERAQTFYIKKGTGVTAKEAYNLLNGRAVNKDLTNAEGKPYNAWMQIDFNQKDNHGNHKYKIMHEAYGFDLEKELHKHPIVSLDAPEYKDRLMRSLERGNLHEVVMQRGDNNQRFFIEANPQFKNLTVYDATLKKVYQDNERKPSIAEDASRKLEVDPREANKKQEQSPKESEVSTKKAVQQKTAPLDDDTVNTGTKKFSRKKMGA